MGLCDEGEAASLLFEGEQDVFMLGEEDVGFFGEEEEVLLVERGVGGALRHVCLEGFLKMQVLSVSVALACAP